MFNQYPPPAVGGPVVKYPLFDLITDNRSHHSIDGSVFTDKLDEAIGLLRHVPGIGDDGEAVLLGASPCIPVRNLDAALDFYLRRLGFTDKGGANLSAGGTTNRKYRVIRRGGAHLMLQMEEDAVSSVSEPLNGGAWAAFIDTPDPGALMAAFRESGVTTHPVYTDDGDRLRGFSLSDPDENYLYFGVMGNRQS